MVPVDGKTHEVDIAWDVTTTGGGRIVVDGAVVDSWAIGAKWPGQIKVFPVAGRRAQMTQSMFSFDLTIDGVQIPQPHQAPWKRPVRSILLIALLVGAVLLLGALFVGLIAMTQ